MRSRYAAYAKGLTDYIIQTTDPNGPQWQSDGVQWAEEITDFCRRTAFNGLHIVEANPTDTNEGFVTFIVRLSREGEDVGFGETSRFARLDGRWHYVSGVPYRGDRSPPDK